MKIVRKLILKTALSIAVQPIHSNKSSDQKLEKSNNRAVSSSHTATMADQQEDYSSLPLTERFVHKVLYT